MLLVEDDALTRKQAEEALTRRGWNVTAAENGKEAFQWLQLGVPSFDVVVLDLRMPEMSGFEMLERVQDEELNIPPVIVLSAYLDEVARQRCGYFGANYVRK